MSASPDFFATYDLLTQSQLFDADFYRGSYPTVAQSNQDPLTHYLEHGARERLDPGPGFDTAYYLEQCAACGEIPLNPLYHYLTVGKERGLLPREQANLLSLDIPQLVNDHASSASQGGLSIVGWAIAEQGVKSIEITIDGERVASARHGLRRPDVAAAHPLREGSLLSGFAIHLSSKVVRPGQRTVAVSLLTEAGPVRRVEFKVSVADALTNSGPSLLRRKMPQTEVDAKLDLLERLGSKAFFVVVVQAPSWTSRPEAARRSLRTLARQTYPHWQLLVQPQDAAEEIVAQFPELSERLKTLEGQRRFFWLIRPGDELGCDALLELAVASAIEPQIDLWYSDDRRADDDGVVNAFFKPAWSPDLLLAFNYIGRAWCVAENCLEGGLKRLCEGSDYDRVLWASERVRAVGHVAKVLYQCGGTNRDSVAAMQAALAGAIERRGLDAQVIADTSGQRFRVKRTVKHRLVSVIIPTCAAGGLIRRCLESLRDVTGYPDLQVVCIENIGTESGKWRKWLTKQADTLISTQQPFNWASFNNLAVAQAWGEYLLFLNDDCEIIEREWLHALVEHAARPEVATVGALLLYPDRTVQHAGFVLDGDGRGRHAFRHLSEKDPGYFGLAHSTRNVIGSTGACLMTRRRVFQDLEGFDASHAVINNDLDYCLRAGAAGNLNVFTPHARLIHHELASRAGVAESYDADKFHRRWRGRVAAGDPYFNPNLSRDHEQLQVGSEPLERVYAGHPRFARASIRRILVVKLDHIGDCLNAVPAVRRLRDDFPTARLTVLSSSASAAVWKADATVDEILRFDFFHARSGQGKVGVTPADLAALEARLHACGFDLAIDLRKQPDTREILQLSGAELLVGFDHQGRFPWLDVALEWDEDVPLRTKHGHVSDDLISLVAAVATHSEPCSYRRDEATGGKLSLPPAKLRQLFAKPLVCIHPAAGSVMRQWPLGKFTALIELLLDLEDYHVAVIGGPDERSLSAEVLQRVSDRAGIFDLTGRLSLDELPRLLARSVLFVGNNSGPQHWAASVGIPTIGIHSGVVDAREWGPLGLRACAVRKDVSCSPCFLEFPEHCQRGLACLQDLPVSYVYQTCLQALGRAAPPLRDHA